MLSSALGLHCSTTHATARARIPRSRALLAAQVFFLALPIELLDLILRRAWAEREKFRLCAAAKVRCAAGLALVCRRGLLRAQPLPLDLHFARGKQLSAAQRRWLLDPGQAGCVEAVDFHFRFPGPAGSQPVGQLSFLKEFILKHGRTLLRLSGMPVELVASVSQAERPALDLSGLRLTKLGIQWWDANATLPDREEGEPGGLWLWPECLPGTLETLECQLPGYSGEEVLWDLAWAPRAGPSLAGQLPRLQTLRVESLGLTWYYATFPSWMSSLACCIMRCLPRPKHSFTCQLGCLGALNACASTAQSFAQ